MSQVFRVGEPTKHIRVPAELPGWVKLALGCDLGEWIEELAASEWESDRLALRTLKRLRDHRVAVGSESTSFSESDLCELRNLLDTCVAEVGRGCQTAVVDRPEIDGDAERDGPCGRCEDCRSTAMRTLIDAILDAAGCNRSAAYAAALGGGGDVEKAYGHWRSVVGGRALPPFSACVSRPSCPEGRSLRRGDSLPALFDRAG